MRNVVLAITSASGAIYAKSFIKKVSSYPSVNMTIIVSEEARLTFHRELDEEIEDVVPRSQARGMNKIFARNESQEDSSIIIVSDDDLSIPFCSGSSAADVMVIMPCDMGTIGEIASGISSCATDRVAEVMIKEKKKLIVVPRESPFSSIHLRNMTILAENGVVIAPASPAFYHCPEDVDELVEAFVGRIIEMAGIARLSEKFKKQI